MSTSAKENSEIDILELWRTIWSKRATILKWSLIGAVVGLIIGFSLPPEYTVTVKTVPEQGSGSAHSGMAGLAAMAGINTRSLSGSDDGITLDAYPEIVMSTPFLIDMAEIPVVNKKGEASTLYDYMEEEIRGPWWSYILRAPGKFAGWIASIGKEEEPDGLAAINPHKLSLKQHSVLGSIQKRIALVSDKKSGVMSVSAQMQDPFVATVTSDSLTSKLEVYMARYRTEKAKRNQQFIEALHAEAREDYHEAQQAYAAYMDVTQNTVLQSVRVEQERLQNERGRALALYNQISQELEAARIKVQEDTPCLTVIEPASVPLLRSNMGKAKMLILFVFLFALGAAGVLLMKEYFLQEKEA